MENIIVLGGDGFVGKNFIRWVREKKLNTSFRFIGASNVNQSIDMYDDWRWVDLTDEDSLKELFRSTLPTYVINLAGLIRSPYYDMLYKVNAHASYLIMEILAKQNSLQKVLLIGSAAEYGVSDKLPLCENDTCNPVSTYGLSKYLQTKYATYFHRTTALPVVVARTFNIIGPGMPDTLAIGAFATKINNAGDGDTIMTGDLTAHRDYLGIGDVCDAYWKLLMRGNPGKVYNICSGKSIAMQKIIDAMIVASGKIIQIDQNSDLTTSGKDVSIVYGDNSRITDDTGWTPKQSVITLATKMVNKIDGWKNENK